MLIFLAIAIIIIYFKRYLIIEFLSFPFFWRNALSTKKGKLKIIKQSYGPHPRQYVLLCLPPDEITVQKTAVIYFHGGGWWLGKPEQFLKHAQAFCLMGHPVIIPSYRRIPRYSFRHIRQDLLMIIQGTNALLKAHTACQSLIVGGMSAGAHLATQMIFEQETLTQAPQPRIKGLYLFGAPLELRAMTPSLVVRALAGSTRSQAFKIANPIDRLPFQSEFPILIIQGSTDGMVPANAAQLFADKLQASNRNGLSYHLLTRTNHLEVASWIFKANETRQIFFNWLKKL